MARSNKSRTEQTRTDLLAAARRLFVERGYADTATPEIAAAAGVTRGALYHHFADKKALFQAVVEQEAAGVAESIEIASPEKLGPRGALIGGAGAFLDAMRQPGRARLLLLDGPAVLGRAAMDEIDQRGPAGALQQGLAFAKAEGLLSPDLPLTEMTALLAAAFDRAALAIDAGAQPENHKLALTMLIDGLLRPSAT